MKRFLHRHQSAIAPAAALRAGIGGSVAIALLMALAHASGQPWLMAPFGASCVLLFSAPTSPLSQPSNLVGGHLVATTIGLIAAHWLPATAWTMPVVVGLAIAAMAALRLTHPPAGATPLVVMLTQAGWDFLLFPVALGSIVLVAVAWAAHRLPGGPRYPLPRPPG